MRGLITAIQFLTIFPVRGGSGRLSASMAYFPVVGALQGLVAVVLYYFFKGLLPGGVLAALILAALTITNGGFHLDGFADTVDGLAGGATPEDRLRIMRDHTTGAVGVVFIVLLLLLKYAAVAGLIGKGGGAWVAGVLVVFPAAGRWSMVPLSYLSGYARSTGGIGEAFSSASLRTLVVSTAIVALISVVLLGFASLVVLFVTGALAYLLSLFFSSKLGGVTGDVFGFQSELGEVLFLLGALLMC